jgi:hypothetical protein
MMMNIAFPVLLFVPIVVLGWRVVSKTRQHWIRVGAAGAAMITAVGAFVIFPTLTDFGFKDWRADMGLVAATTGNIYLLVGAQRHKGNGRHRTLSIIAAIIGLVPIAGAIATGLLFGGHPA